MNNTRDAAWVRHLFRYQAQQREHGRLIGGNAVEVVKVAAALTLTEQRPSAIRIAAESATVLPDKTVRQTLDRLFSLRVLRPRDAGLMTGAPEVWQNYNAHSPDPAGIERQVGAFIKDLEGRISDLQRRQPRKRMA